VAFTVEHRSASPSSVTTHEVYIVTGGGLVTREDMVEQSVTDLVRAGIEASDLSSKIHAQGLPDRAGARTTAGPITQVAVGFNFDDGGKLMELGSDLTERIYTITFWTFGTTRRWAARRRTSSASSPSSGPDPAEGHRRIIGQPVIDQLTPARAPGRHGDAPDRSEPAPVGPVRLDHCTEGDRPILPLPVLMLATSGRLHYIHSACCGTVV
jgi:hypothetical protein